MTILIARCRIRSKIVVKATSQNMLTLKLLFTQGVNSSYLFFLNSGSVTQLYELPFLETHL